MRPAYKDLYFGKSDSRNEANEDVEAFLRSYVDLNDATGAVVSGSKFLVLGPKGTGKSALAWYLQFSATRLGHNARVRDASSLPLAEVPRLRTGQSEGPERTVTAWKFILLCNYLELLLGDSDVQFRAAREVKRVARLLREFGFVGDSSGRALLQAASTTLTIPITQRGELYKREGLAELTIYNLVPYLETWVASASSNSRHVLVLDGLDSIFLNDTHYDESLASLVQAAYDVNQKFREQSAAGSIALLLRNDVFSRIALRLPDSQKMRDDLSFDLDWRVLSGEAGVSAPLVQLVNAKAARALGIDSVDVLSYFPSEIQVGRRGDSPRGIPSLQYLLNMTRHTPRDLLRVLEEIRKVEASGVYGASGSGVLSDEVVREGILQYSTKYFVGAIQNEFAGYEGGPESAAAALSALKTIGKQRFDRGEFRKALAETAPEQEAKADRLLELLFFAGAIGNSVGQEGKSYMQFYHRRDEAQIYLRGAFILHHALIHAWGMRRSGDPGAATPPRRTPARQRRITRRGEGETRD